MTKFSIKTTQMKDGTNYLASGGSIMFYNGSTTDTIKINGFPVPPQSVLVVDANQDERNTTIYNFVYLGTDRLLTIREKIFI